MILRGRNNGPLRTKARVIRFSAGEHRQGDVYSREGWSWREGGKKAYRPVEPEHCFACVRIQKSRAQNTTSEKTSKAEKKLRQTRKYKGRQTLCMARIDRYDGCSVSPTSIVRASRYTSRRYPLPDELRRAAWPVRPRNALRYLGVLRHRQKNTIADGKSE